MKIDRRNPRHWARLARFGLIVLLARLIRLFRAPAPVPAEVVLYGHRLTGNLQAIHREHIRSGTTDLRLTYLSMDSDYVKALRAEDVRACDACSLDCLRLLVRARAVISDHGLHVLVWLLGVRRLAFFDVWHGIPFKGFDADDFRVQHRYDETWVASPSHRDLYRDRFGFDPARIRITGYARTDELVSGGPDRDELLRQFGLQAFADRPLVLFAPTWQQDSRERSLFPFNTTGEEFMAALASACKDHRAVVMFRSHLNSTGSREAAVEAAEVVALPFASHPDTERLLQLADVLICDWSSIAFDYLLLQRPTIFLDVPPPFRKGFSLGPEHRFGLIVEGIERLRSELKAALADPSAFMRVHGDEYRARVRVIYGECADGKSAGRCLGALRESVRAFR